MIKFILSRFISREKAVELLEDHEEKISEISEKNKHLSTAVKAGYKLWSIWKIILLCWYGFLLLLIVGITYLIYHIVTKFI